MILFGFILIAIVFVKAYKNFVLGQACPRSIEIVELGKETIRRGSTLLLHGSHKLLPNRTEASYQPLEQDYSPGTPQVDREFSLDDLVSPRHELSKSLDDLQCSSNRSDFVRGGFLETDRESLIHADNEFIRAERRRCSLVFK